MEKFAWQRRAAARDESAGQERPTTKWWEQYYVRYFVGTFVGVVVIFALRERALLAGEIKTLLPAFADIRPAALTAVAFAGLAYCYIASAPVLTLHMVRGSWASLTVGRQSEWKWILGAYALAILSLTIAIGLGGSYPEDAASLKYVGWLLLFVVVATQLALIAVATLKIEDSIAFYKNLASQRRLQKSDYVESYRHLREHGNAKMIVVFELVLGVALSTATTMTQFICYVIVWILPATLSWFVATALEGAMARGP